MAFAATEDRWWRVPRIRHHVNGVFQGGGARGVAYIGALQELDRCGVWFDAVAGSSAGAIVATFISAGFTPGRLLELVPDATKEIRPLGRRGWLSSGSLETLGHYDTEPLRVFIETRIRQALGIALDRARDVTFQELYEATEIELNIVVLSAPSTPIVLNRWSAPDSQVSYAAVASSAIPVVLTPQMLPRSGSLAGNVVIDGGAWANYPTFVFKDPSVRAFYDAPPVPADRKVVGFVLCDEAEPAASSSRWAPLRRYASFGLFAACLLGLQMLLVWLAGMVAEETSGWQPFAVFGAFLAVVAFTVVARRLLVPGARMASRVLAAFFRNRLVWWMTCLCVIALQLVFLALLTRWALDWRGGLALLFISGIVVCYLLIGLAVVLFRYGEAIIVTGLPAMRAAMRATTGVPEWAGASGHDLVVAVPVMHGVETTSFDLEPPIHADAAKFAADGVRNQLDRLVTHLDGGPAPPDRSSGAGRDLTFLTAAVRSNRAAQFLDDENRRTAQARRWGATVWQVTHFLFSVAILQVAAYTFAPSPLYLSNADPRIGLGLFGTNMLVAFGVCMVWRALLPTRIAVSERARAVWCWCMAIVGSVAVAGAVTQLLRPPSDPGGGHLLAYDLWYVSRLWAWLPGNDLDPGSGGPTWAGWLFVAIVAWATGVLILRLLTTRSAEAPQMA